MDDLGLCRFHRGWAEEMMPEVLESLFGLRQAFLDAVAETASRINSRNAGVFWESERALEFVETYLKRARDVEGNPSPELAAWIDRFAKDRHEAALDWWFDVRKGIDESLTSFH